MFIEDNIHTQEEQAITANALHPALLLEGLR